MPNVDNQVQPKDATAASQSGNNGINFYSIMAGAAFGASPFVAKVATSVAHENARDLTPPLEVLGAVAGITADHMNKNPLQSTTEAVVLGPGSVVQDAVIRKVAESQLAKTAVRTAEANANAEAKQISRELAKNPSNPGGVLAQETFRLGSQRVQADLALGEQLLNQSAADIRNLPEKANEFERKRPITSTSIDAGVSAYTGSVANTGSMFLPGVDILISSTGVKGEVDKAISTVVKGALQERSDKLDATLRFLGIRP